MHPSIHPTNHPSIHAPILPSMHASIFIYTHTYTQERAKYKQTGYWLSQGFYDACSLIDRELLVEDFKRQKHGLQVRKRG
jgi:hypothetical protein